MVGDATPKRFMEISGYTSTDHHLEIGGQKASLAQMYNTYSNTMDAWQIDNLKNYQA